MTEEENQQTEQSGGEGQDDRPEDGERPSLTSPPGGRTHEATTPPGQGDLDEEAADKSREGLDRAGGGH
jgi:hypothetical protein